MPKNDRRLIDIIRNNNRIIISGDHRKEFMDTILECFYYNTIMNKGTVTVLFASGVVARKMLGKIKTFYKATPKRMFSEVVFEKCGCNEFSIRFSKLSSRILILNISNPPRGFAIRNAFVLADPHSELDEELMMSLECCVPIDGKIIIDKTSSLDVGIFDKIWNMKNYYYKYDYENRR